MVLGKSPPQSPPPRPHAVPHFHPWPRSVPGTCMGCRQTHASSCHRQNSHLQSGSEVPPGRGHGHSPPAQLDKENFVSKVTSRVMARTVSSMLTVVLVAVGLEPGDGKLETLRLKPGRAV